MQASSAPITHDFGGHFASDGGPQLVGNNISTNGGPVNIGLVTDDMLPVKICELPNFVLSPHFTGRDNELEQIERIFSLSSGDIPQCCAIHGMPGVGKTQLALRFATLASQTNQYPYIFWASGASVEKLSQDVSQMVDLLRLPGRHMMSQASKLTAARAWLGDQKVANSWLLVLDNVNEDTSVNFRDILPRHGCGGRILMTTRSGTIAERYTTPEGSSQLHLHPPGIGDAVAMLLAGANLKREDREVTNPVDAERLVQSVGSLPLAIDQAASFIKMTGSSLQKVLDVYNSEEVSEILTWENDLSRYEEKSVVATFTPALDRIKQTAPDALILLRLLCFCDPEAIFIDIFESGCDALHQGDRYAPSQAPTVDKLKSVKGCRPSRKKVSSTPRRKSRQNAIQVRDDQKLKTVQDLFRSHLRLSKAIQEVQRSSLIAYSLEGGDRVIRIHDLIHILLRSKLITKMEGRQWLQIAIEVICKAFEGIDDPRSPQYWSQCSRFISHIESLEKFAQQYKLESRELLGAGTWAAVYLFECGLYEKAVRADRRTLQRKQNILGQKHPDTVVNMCNLVSVLDEQGKYEEAERMCRQTLALAESVRGKEHPDTLTIMSNLALVLQHQGKYEEAERISRPTLALSESVLGKKHPDTLTSMNNLALLLESQGKAEEAEQILRQALALSESVLGKEHPKTLNSLGALASTYWKQDRWEEAEGLQVQVMETEKRILGAEHPDTLNSMDQLASTWKSQSRNEEAISLMRDCLELRNRILGPEHPHTKASLACLRIWEGEDEVEAELNTR